MFGVLPVFKNCKIVQKYGSRILSSMSDLCTPYLATTR